jgi:hypothetical protein
MEVRLQGSDGCQGELRKVADLKQLLEGKCMRWIFLNVAVLWVKRGTVSFYSMIISYFGNEIHMQDVPE